MYECPKCGGDLRFDITSQKLKCRYCKNSFPVTEMEKEEDAEAHVDDSYQVTVYTCPSCGAELESTNLQAAGFCSYCGSAVVFSKRIIYKKRPKRIIPFQVDKTQCIRLFQRHVSSLPFAPKELKNEKLLEHFIGFYLPFWNYKLIMQGHLDLEAVIKYNRGNNLYYDTCHVQGDVDAAYEGVCYDASSSFEDSISRGISPFRGKDIVPFSPGYMLGYYADVADVPAAIYEKEASYRLENKALTAMKNKISGKGTVKLKNEEQVLQNIGKNIEQEAVLLPVWFLTYRDGDRLGYAVVNGDNGNIYADIPVNQSAFLRRGLLLAIPVFAVLMLFLSLTPHALLFVSFVVSLLTIILYRAENKKILEKSTRERDAGYQYARVHGSRPVDAPETGQHQEKKAGDRAEEAAVPGEAAVAEKTEESMQREEPLPEEAHGVRAEKPDPEEENRKQVLSFSMKGRKASVLPAFFALIISGALFLINPVEDEYSYAGAVLAMLALISSIRGIISQYNLLATRPLPSYFARKEVRD